MNRKPLIAIIVDNHNWCWTKTAEDLAYHLTEYDFEIITAYNFKKMDNFHRFDGIYFRGHPNAFIDFADCDCIPPYISTLSTGGKALDKRLEEMRDCAKKGWGLIVQNKYAYHRARAEHYERVFLIPNGVNTTVYTPKGSRQEVVFVGMSGDLKGERAILKGSPFVKSACSNIDDLYYVETHQERPLNYEQMIKWYQALTIYAQPSESEGCSNSVMEAMSCGLPCLICESVGYHGEVCLDGRDHINGQVLFVERNPESIQAAISFLLTFPEDYRRISQNARRFALQHDWKHIALRYHNVIKEFLENNTGGKMIKKIKDFTCYGGFITAIVKDSPDLKEKMKSVDCQIFRASEKIAVFKPDGEPEWFSEYPDWNYAYSNSDDLSEIAGELANNPWYTIIDEPVNPFVLMKIAEQMKSIDIVKSLPVFEWAGTKVYKK